MTTTAKRVTVVPGDDAAPEAMAATMTVLEHMRLPIDWTVLGPGESLSAKVADASDTVLFGSSNGSAAGLAHLRYGWGTYANVRPTKYIPGVPSALKNPEGIDYVIVREALEDVYSGIEGRLDTLLNSGLDLTTHFERSGAGVLRYPFRQSRGGVYSIKLFTREGVERVARFAARLAASRKAQGHPGRVTIGGKWNVNPVSDRFFRDVASAAIAEVPEVSCNAYLADDLGRRLVMSPHEFDVVLLPNLYGDLFSDVAAGTIGGLGMAPSGGFGEDRAYFEPVHGSAPDIAGRNIINPTATLLSAAMMLEHLGLGEAATALASAIASVIADGRILPADLGGTASTDAFGHAVAERC
jgi:isocitrate/isopropylmalate dehydrogenase